MDAYILHLETATKVCSVALSLNGELKQLRETLEEGYSHGENLTVFVEEVLRRENIVAGQLAAVSVASGPGSYTGLRIGVSTAKGLCYALGIPLLAIDSLQAIAQQAHAKYPTRNIIPMIDARRMEVFSAVYGPEKELLKPIAADVLEMDSYAAFEPFVACGDGAAKLKELWQSRDGIVFEENMLSTAAAQCLPAFVKYKSQAFEDLAYFEPFYLKDFVMTTPKAK
jgi:tRNA threonylcarbamoyladenosine biosynthesis protein TsaB